VKLALFADVHANLEALTACLEHARSLGAGRHAFLGDLVGYGADPVAVLDLIARQAELGAVAVLGNHDAAALGRAGGPMNPHAEISLAWTRAQLGERQRAFLAALPLSARVGDMLFVHASALQPDRWTYVSGPVEAERSLGATEAGLVFSGHVHEQKLFYAGADGKPVPFTPVPGTPIPIARHRRWLAIAGSAGQPRDHNNAACYLMADLERLRLTFFRIPYDYRSAAHKIRAAGLPDRLARRLERGA